MERTGEQLPERQRERCAWPETEGREGQGSAGNGVLTYTKRKTLEERESHQECQGRGQEENSALAHIVVWVRSHVRE